MNTPSTLRIAVGIATAGRREQLQLTLAQLARQTLHPCRVVVCPASPADLDPADLPLCEAPTQVVQGGRGLTRQRNAILRACDDVDLLFFMDDDYYPARDYLERVHALFVEQPRMVIATNHPDRDGASGPGVSHEEALAILSQVENAAPQPRRVRRTTGGYGCNMTLRMAAVRDHDVRFDEGLPLYGWLEDIDFSRRLAAHGTVLHSSDLHGVHLATKSGRTSGLRFGYSQVANPLHMMAKGNSLPVWYGLWHVAKNMAMNRRRLHRPEPWVDRAGRWQGNWLAWRDWWQGRLHPDRILALGATPVPTPRPPVYVISLARSTYRRQWMTGQLDRLGLPFEIVDAVDGEHLDAASARVADRRLLPAEQGCLLSHAALWQRMVDQRTPWAVILEDDVHLAPSITDFLAQLQLSDHEPVLCKLETMLATVTLERGALQSSDSARIHRLLGNHGGTGAYVLNLHAATLLVAQVDDMRLPVDTELFDPQRRHTRGLQVFQACPALAVQDMLLPRRLRDPALASIIGSERADHAAGLWRSDLSGWGQVKKRLRPVYLALHNLWLRHRGVCRRRVRWAGQGVDW